MKNVSLENKVGELLIKCGITPEIKGFQYIIDAVCAWDGEKNCMEIYYEVAYKHRVRWTKVERIIRHAFGKLDYSKKNVKAFFGEIEPKNYKLISVIAWRCREE